MGYTKTTWVEGAAPGISAANLNNLETQYDQALADTLPVVSTYTGNDADDRQITTGFVCKLVIVQGYTGVVQIYWLCFATNQCLQMAHNSHPLQTVDVLLHATNGFIVDHLEANHNGVVYTYIAFK